MLWLNYRPRKWEKINLSFGKKPVKMDPRQAGGGRFLLLQQVDTPQKSRYPEVTEYK